ncbi:MAG TPA: hypothetical protein ENJ28_02850 [Gammaproteobacteria bacterium]|nr:hypothetical protein [Gammaproteobacteria bacterium]
MTQIKKQKEPFDDTTKSFYSALFKGWGLNVETECEIFARSRCIDLVIQCKDAQQTQLQNSVFNHFRQLNALELKGHNDPLTIRDYNRIMMRAWGLGAIDYKKEQEQPSRLPKDRTLTIVCVNRPQKILDSKQNLLGFKPTEHEGIYLSAGFLDQWLIYPSELALIERNYPLLVLAKGNKLEQFITLCIQQKMHDYLDLALRVGTLNDPYTVWKEILKVKQMNTIQEETWSVIDQFFKEAPEGFTKVKSLQEKLLDKWREGRQEGRKEGQEEGREKGLEEGKRETARSTLIHLLSRKFTDVPEDIINCIEKTEDLAQLEDWFDQAIMAVRIEEIKFL